MRKLPKYQQEMIRQFENLTGFELMAKDKIVDRKTFWETWDHNVRWLRDLVTDVEYTEAGHSHRRPI